MTWRLTPRQWEAVRLCERRGNLRRTTVCERYDVPGELWDRVRLTPEFAAWLAAHDERAERRRPHRRKEE